MIPADDNIEHPPTVGTGYPVAELTRAFVTSLTDRDPAVRDRAERRLHQWRQVVTGMLDGTLRIGSRTPVRDWPVWVTPTVVRGGFATGAPAAGHPPDSSSAFADHLTERGLAELIELLDSRRYRVDVPEEAVLLTVAWLVCAGDAERSQQLVDVVRPFAGQLRFHPRQHTTPMPEPGLVWRYTVGETRAALAERRPNQRVMAHREALQVWAPFGDELLALWLETVDDAGQIAGQYPPGWVERAAVLLDRYRVLAERHTLCGKHRRPKENLAILRGALEEVVAGRDLSGRARGMLRHAVRSMADRRGEPGSDRLRALREQQASHLAARPHHEVARELAARLATLVDGSRPDGRVLDDEAGLTPSQLEHVLPAEGPVVPAAVRRVVERARAGTVEELVQHGIVASAEVLASLAPRIAASTVAAGYPDPAARALVAATYTAFRRRRSLLLLDLEKQVQFEELPWVQAIQAHRAATGAGGVEVATRLAGTALQTFPGTPLPNRLVRELDLLARQAGHPVPMVEELAADIFRGTFSPKFAHAARLAADVLTRSLYARYYRIDYQDLLRRTDPEAPAAGDAFARLCAERAGPPGRGRGGGRAVAANGMVIEQAQILTTHNLAALVSLGVRPANGWAQLAGTALDEAIRLLGNAQTARHRLRLVKNAAYAWRQAVFFLSMSPEEDRPAVLDQARAEAPRRSQLTRDQRQTLLDGLADPGTAAPFLGWTLGPHPFLLAAPT
ncbi:MAG TPA: hypothetical protein VI248_14505 [Kineosporiaceae bacterium]